MADIKYNNCNDRIDILKNETVPRRLTKFEEIQNKGEITTEDFVYVDSCERNKKIRVSTILNSNRIKSDWNVKDEDNDAFILNKPGCDNLESDMVSLYTVGGVTAGQVFSKGTSVREILDMILSLNRDGYFLGEVVDYNPENITEEQLMEFDRIPERRKVINTEVLSKGYYWNISPDNEYFFVAIPSPVDTGINVEKIQQAGFDIEIKYKKAGDYKVWYFDKPSKGNFILKILFKNEG